MIKVFYDNKVFFLTDTPLTIVDDDAIQFELSVQSEVLNAYHASLSSKKKTKIYFIHQNEKELFNYFLSIFGVVNAAGGLVKNEMEEFLFIFRNGKWDLPKGKIEEGEEIEDAAIREVEEECGVKELKIIKKLTESYHIYYVKEKPFIKRTYWFEMVCPKVRLVPQAEEGIEEARWLKKSELPMIISNTYANLLEILKYIK